MSARFGAKKRERKRREWSVAEKKERDNRPTLSAPPIQLYSILTRAELSCPAGDVFALRLEAGDGLCCCFGVFVVVFRKSCLSKRSRFFVVRRSSSSSRKKHATSKH